MAFLLLVSRGTLFLLMLMGRLALDLRFMQLQSGEELAYKKQSNEVGSLKDKPSCVSEEQQKLKEHVSTVNK